LIFKGNVKKSPQEMLLSTVYKSLNFQKSSTLSGHRKCGFTSRCGWLLRGGNTFCPSWVNCQLSTSWF
jgi:hypothetical protein